MSPNSDAIEHTILMFSQIYLGGIPPTITNDSAYLSFICVLTGIEALAGYRYSDVKGNAAPGERFRRFVAKYFPGTYGNYVDDLWEFRCGVVHSFTPGKFRLMHHHSECHLTLDNGAVVLNAEDFYGALLWAAQKYVAELRIDPNLRSLMMARLASPDGGGISVGLTEGPKAPNDPSPC